MIKEAIEKILQLKKDPVVNIDGEDYNCLTNNQLVPMEIVNKIKIDELDSIKTQTLTSIIDYLIYNPDKLNLEKLYIVIKNEKNVYLESTVFGDYRQKEIYMDSTYKEPHKDLNSYMTLESMLIMLNSTFGLNDDLQNLVKVISAVSENEVKDTFDNGISQTVKVKSGIDMNSEAKLPRLVTLIPFRTFPESDQPESDFLFRAKKGAYGLEYALFPADGGAWKNQAILNIKKWLQETLQENDLDVPILA